MKVTKLFSAKILSLCVTLLTLTGCSHMPSGTRDPSAKFLSSILSGTPDSVLNGTWNGSASFKSVLPIVFHYFNTALLGGSLFIFAWITILGVIYTAQDGIFLGKKWGKTLVPLRAIIGVISVFPIGSAGFCIAQWVIYTLAYIGIGLANAVWVPIATDIQPASNGTAGKPGVMPVMPQNLQAQIQQDAAMLMFNDYAEQDVKCSSGDASSCTISSSTPVAYAELPNSMYQIIDTATGQNNGESVSVKQTIDADNKNNPTFSQYVYKHLNAGCGGLNCPFPATFSDIQQSGSTYNYVQSSLSTNVSYNILLNEPSNDSKSPIVQTAKTNLSDNVANPVVTKSEIPSAMYQDTALQNLFSNEVNAIITAIENNPDGTPTKLSDSESNPTLRDGSNPFVSSPISWWTAGDHYLDLDIAFAQNIAKFTKAANQFNVNSKGTNFDVNYTFTGTEFKWHVLTPTLAGISYNGDGYGASTTQFHTISSGDTKYPTLKTDSTDAPGENGTGPSSLPSLAVLIAKNGSLASIDLACRLGDNKACANSELSAYDYYQKSQPVPLSDISGQLSQDLQEQLHAIYYVRYEENEHNEDCTGKPATGSDVCTVGGDSGLNQKLDTLLDYTMYVSNLPLSSGGIPGNPVGPDAGNPFINAGSKAFDGPNSATRDTLGFLFSGLLGYNAGSGYYGGLMNQIWCIGMPLGSSKNPNDPSYSLKCPNLFANSGNPDPNIVARHFSMIRSTQLVGVNLISGVIVGLMTTFSNYKKMVQKIVVDADNKSSVSSLDMIGAAYLGPSGGFLWSNAFKASQTKDELASMVAIANLSVTLMWLPLMIFVFTLMFTTGVMFAITIPLLPYILYWAGKVAWILLILEGLFAAPIVGLAIAYPDGHDVWGMAENGFKISFNIILMPVLMVGGLITAIVLTYGVISMSAIGFHDIVYSILNLVGAAGADNTLQGVDPTRANTIIEGTMGVFVIFMYAYFLQMAFEKCFSAIYVIPERVMQWIGGQGMKFGEQEGKQMAQKSDQTAQQGVQAGGQTVSQGAQAENQLGQSEVKQSYGDTNADMQQIQGDFDQGRQSVESIGKIAGGG